MRQLSDARAHTATLVKNMLFSSVELVSKMGRDLVRERLLTESHIFAKDGASMARVAAEIAGVRADYAATALAYEPLATLPGESAMWQKLKDDVTAIEDPLDHALALSGENRDTEARDALVALDPRFTTVEDDIGTLRQINRDGAAEAIASIDALQRRTTTLTWLRTLVGIFLSIAVGGYITRRIAKREDEGLRRQEALQTSNQELEEFAGRVAHDLRDPLTPVAIAAARLSLVAPEQGRLTAILQRGVTRMELLIDDLLALSRLGANVHQGVSDPAVALAEMRKDLTVPAENVSIHIDVEPARVKCGEGLLRQVVWNLTDNAMKYRREGAVTVVEIRRRVRGRDYELSVRDNGVGMSREDARKAFEPFYRAPHTRSQPGTGLGLTIVKRVIDASGGRISLTSQPAEGTIFRILLPLASAELEALSSGGRTRAPA